MALVRARDANLLLLTQDERLHPLDRDPEWEAYHRRFPLSVGSPPDLYPRLRRFCTLSHETARLSVDNLIDRIQGRPPRGNERRVPSVAETVAGAFIGLYEAVIDELEALIEAGQAPPGAQAEIDRLQVKIDTLNQFIASLGSDGQ